jgi:hypothetical protein
MTLDERYDLFIRRATELHGNKFTYIRDSFSKQKDKMRIICHIHGEFHQCPDKHIAKNSKGCPKCWDVTRSEMLTNIKRVPKPILDSISFLNRATKKYGDKFLYDLSNYTGIAGNKITITCKLHGVFNQTPISHLSSGHGCPSCGLLMKVQNNTDNYDVVIGQLNYKFNGLYEYPEYNKFNYKNKKSIIDIICKTHGLFKKKTQKHLSGQGCFQCRVDEMIRDNILVGGYSENLFIEKPELKDADAYLYYLTINGGKFYKIGISRVSVDNRIKGIKSKAKGEIEQIEKTYAKSGTLYECFIIEQKILNDFSSSRIFKPWSTELFSIDISEDIKHLFA